MYKNINILIIGMGNHSQRIYIPFLKKVSKETNLKFYGLDVVLSKSQVESKLNEKGYDFERFYIQGGLDLSSSDKKILDEILVNKKINAVVIATPPEYHMLYAHWALKHKLHILMDKPISARKNSSTDLIQAKKLVSDYRNIVSEFERQNKNRKLVFMVNTQRRYEIGYKYVNSLIEEATKKFNIPVTSIQAMHGDGVWIFPDEIIEQNCHQYYDGYGKCSHSGFHLFDIVWQFYKAGYVKDKFADQAEVYSSFLQPKGLIKQFTQNDYKKIFGDKYNLRDRKSDSELNDIYNGYGENDAFTNIRLLKDNENICNISINLLHNSLSDRSWVTPSNDLYKGNGRVKHQYYYIQQGPFQTIQIHNYQSKGKQDNNGLADYEVGGNNHFDINIFRNAKMFGGRTKSFTKVTLKDLDTKHMLDDKRLYHETAKEQIVSEFLNSIEGKTNASNIKSFIDTYDTPVQIMSAVYQSNVKYINRKNPLVKFNIKDEEH